ncbi:ABC transporter ATP-binding protein [Amphritea balenae]|uniref:ABC transporter ATP-binding protein n=1 Tax=Amphritea balenae TaxID=452629 RepID=A0A3P1SLM1_9GAMM|nr:ABC transporter ATP-binding protein [Amphritea balenae]RRC98036.1 ABC transporter ATP-binding protein [Amphritea balenae]GGK67039.1 ABC transporter ATP-binding protein [Amphritea balenae]
MTILQAVNLDKHFGGVAAVTDLSFSVTEGEIYSVIGPNGAGKTTLFNMLCGYYVPSGGSITFAGKDLAGMETHQIAAQGISRTFQNLQVFYNMTVLENVMVGCHMRTRTGLIKAALRLPSVIREERQVREWSLEALTLCGLEHLADREAGSLPYGELKRLEIARALASDPKFLAMDEPAAGLNDTETVEMRQLIQRLKERGITILLVEHNMGLVMQISDRVLVLGFGCLLAEGTPQEVQNNPAVIKAYLGEDV